jgi:hypothetical protein
MDHQGDIAHPEDTSPMGFAHDCPTEAVDRNRGEEFRVPVLDSAPGELVKKYVAPTCPKEECEFSLRAAQHQPCKVDVVHSSGIIDVKLYRC